MSQASLSKAQHCFPAWHSNFVWVQVPALPWEWPWASGAMNLSKSCCSARDTLLPFFSPSFLLVFLGSGSQPESRRLYTVFSEPWFPFLLKKKRAEFRFWILDGFGDSVSCHEHRGWLNIYSRSLSMTSDPPPGFSLLYFLGPANLLKSFFF